MTTLALITAAFVGGALNSLAGGGTLVTFPALLFIGRNPIDANASSLVALFPGTFAGAWAFRRSILAISEFNVKVFIALSGAVVSHRARIQPDDLLHRKKYPEGLRCDEAAVDGRNGIEIEREANEFAATSLMPLDDFRQRIPVKSQPISNSSVLARHDMMSRSSPLFRDGFATRPNPDRENNPSRARSTPAGARAAE